MLSIFICHASEDAGLAAELAVFLERGTGARIFLEEGRTGPECGLIAKVNEGRMADVVLALLSAASSPPRWPLAEWQEAFRHGPARENVAVATLLLGRCGHPELLRRGNWFELGPSPLAFFRDVKRWVLGLRAPQAAAFVPAASPYPVSDAQLERLAEALADRPGFATIADARCALAFAARHSADFEAVLWAAADGGEAALAGELGVQAGLPGGRPPEDALRALRRLCAGHRILVLLDGAAADPLGLHQPGGLTSLLAVNRAPVPLPRDLSAEETRMAAALTACHVPSEGALAIFAAGMDPAAGETALAALEFRGLALRPDARHPLWLGLCAAEAGPELMVRHATLAARSGSLAPARQAFRAMRAAGNHPLAVEAGRRAASLALGADRLAEAFELLEALRSIAEAAADDELLQYTLREQCRILECWGNLEESARLRRSAGAYCGMQQSLFG